MKLIDKEAAKPPSLIPPKAKIEDVIIPVDRIELIESNWLTHPLLLEGPACLKVVGGEFSIVMPVQIGTATRNYTFAFKVIGVE